MNFSITKPKTAVILLVVIGCIVFGNTLQNDYNLDDNYYTNGNKLTEGVKNIPDIIVSPTFFGPNKEGFDYRPVTAITFALEHQFFGYNSTISHFFNLVLYILTVILVFTLLRQLVKADNSVDIAFWISLIFLVHPLHTEVVASIKSRDEILSLLFAVLAWRSAVKFSESGKYYQFIVCVLFFGLGMFSKYSLLPFCALIPVSLYFFKGYTLRQTIFLFIGIFAFGLVCHSLKSLILPPSSYVFSISENGLTDPAYGWYERSATSAYVMGRYLLLHFVPLKLVFYYGFKYVQVVGWNSFIAIFSLILYGILLGYCLRNYRRRSLIVYGIVVYVAFMFVYSNFIELSPGMMAERFCYCASLGFSIALVALVINYEQSSSMLNLKFALPVLAILFSIRSIERIPDWKDKETLYSHDVKIADNSAMVNYIYADWKLSKAILDSKKLRQPIGSRGMAGQQITADIKVAEEYFNKVLKINPKDSIAEYSLITCAYQLGNYQIAMERVNRVIQKYPSYWESYFMRGVIEKLFSQNQKAINDFRTVVQNSSLYIPAYEQLHRTLLTVKDTSSALEVLSKAIQNFPKSPVPYAEMANFYISIGDTLKAVPFAEKAVVLPPPNEQVLQFLSRYFKKTGQQEKFEFYQNLIDDELLIK